MYTMFTKTTLLALVLITKLAKNGGLRFFVLFRFFAILLKHNPW